MRSKGEQRCYLALETLGSYLIREQFQIGNKLRVDFVIKELGLAVEFDGSQHSEFNGHFYDSKEAFKAALQRDRSKEQLLKEAGLVLVRLDEHDIKQSPNKETLGQLILNKASEARAKEEASADWGDDWE